MLSPPQRHALLMFDHDPFAILLDPFPIRSSVLWVFQNQLLFLETRDNLDAPIKNRVRTLSR